MKYTVVYRETIVHTFDIEADSKEEAEQKFDEMMYGGSLDFSDGEVLDGEYEVK